ADLQRIVGMFVNTLAMRNYPEGEKIYRLFLREVIEQSIQAFANQDVQFEELVGRLAVERDPSRNPLFDITMVLQNFRRAKALTTAAELVPERKTLYKNPTSKFDMTIFVQERNDDVHIVIEYYTAIFKLSTIQRFATHFTNVIKAVSLEPESSLKDIEILTPGEKSQVLYEFNCSRRDFPKGMTIHGLFEGQVDRAAGAVALNYKDRMISYGALDAQANRLARYLCHEKGIKPEDKVGIWMSPSLERVIAILGVLKAGAGYVPIDPVLPVGRIEYMIKDAVIGLVLSEKKYIRDLERLQWECREFHTYLCLDSFAVHSETESERNELMDKELWRHVGETAVDDITAGGWLSSYTGEPFSREEMDEYGDNILAKLSSLLHPETRVLEIGCASGISMYRIAHRVGFYYGTDLSASVINRGKKELVQKGIQNITLSCLEAHEIDRIAEKNFDLIIINSVIQCFHGYNYLRRVIEKSINLLSEKGYLFIGDVMDLEKKKALVQELMEFKRCNRGKGYSTKTDFSAELFVSRGFWKDLQTEFSGIQAVEFSPKIYTIENELTKFRYDVLLKINKKITPKKPAGKVKFQQDLRALKDMEDSPLDLPIKAGNPAYIIYTSGTTGKPKGVMIEHTPVVNFIFSMYTDYEKNFGPADHCLGLTNFCFDVSVCEIFMPLVFGASIVLPAYKKFFDPGLVADVIIKKSITFTYLPPGLLQEIVDCLAVRLQGLTAGLELNKLLVGVEPIKDEILEAYLRLNPGMKIINGYGPTETTICASAYRYEPGNPEGKRVPIGRPLANMSIVLLDKCDHFVPVGVPGELCIAGTGLARGYLNRPEFTAEKFKRAVIKNLSKPTDDPCPMTNDRFYKTGDLARWLPDGNIMFIGRIDHQVKVRGFRIELGEIESLLQKHEAVRAAVVTVNNEDAYLCAYIITSDKDVLDSQLKEYLEESLPDYMIPSYFIQLEKLPLTPNGKIDRKALPVPGYKVDESYTAPTNEIEKKLTLIWSEILGIKEDAISIDAGFFNMGGHSLKATILASRVHKELNVLLPLAEVFKTPTVRGLAAYIKSVARQEYASIEPVEKKEYYPLSSAQKRLYILQQFDPGSVSYNMPQVIPLAGGIDLQKLESIFQVLIARHESLRTSFEMVNNEPVQIIHDKVEFEINKSFARLFQKRPLDLSCAPLLRMGFTGERLWVDMHHIITDGVSQSVLSEEFEALYKGQDLAPLKLQYKDYSHWQNSREHQVIIKQQESYWLREFSGELPVLDLPVDFARPPVQSFSGGTVGFVIESAGTQALKKIMAEAGVSLFMVILAVFNVLLSRLSGQEDIVVGTPVAGRRHADLERIIGMFVNTLALRNYPAGEKPFLVFLAELKERTLAVFENQEYPFEDLVDKLSLARDTGRNPIFDVVFNLLNQQEHNSVIENIGNLNKHKRSAAKFDMTLTGGELGERLFFSIEYCTRLFESGTIDRMIQYFKHIVEELALEPNLRIGEIEIITQQEREQILHEFNDTVTVCSSDKTIQQLFAEQVERTSDHMALVGADLRVCPNCLTYRELHEQSNRLAGLLIEKGVQAGSIVAIKIERSLEMIIGILGILKSGGAYLPIAHDYPQERIDYMLNDSGSKMVVNSELIKNVSFHHSSFLIPHSNSANNLAYIIYTSGSTGKPKGVPIRHDNLSPLLHWGCKQLGIGTKDRFLQNVAYYFDWSVWEIVMALSSGASLYLAADEMPLDPGKCIPFMEKNGITVLHATPGQYGYFIDVGVKLQTLKYLFLGAEKLTFDLLTRALDSVNEDCRVFNMYGPTECTIISAVYEIERLGVNALASRGLSSVPIGVAVGITGLMILDNYKKMCPMNVTGELYIAGNGVACGYLNNPELTNQKFLKTQMSESFFKTVPGFYYKTGDLARWLSDGNIEFLGRIDQQVKIRGFRIELGEIEKRLTKYPGIKQAIVLDLAGEQDKYLCAYVISDKEYGLTELRGFLAEALPDYMIPSYFVAIKKVPLSANGKINRRALPKPGLNLVDRYIAPTNEIEKKLVVLWAELLGISSSRISIDDNFFHLGGHSLKATQLTARIHRLFNVEISLVELFKNPTVRGTASVISKAEVMLFMDIKKAEKKDFYELSFNQKRLWFIQQMNPAGSSFNMPGRWVFNHPVEDEWIEETLSQMMLRHESLRTGFKVIADQPVQYIMNEALLPLKRMDISMLSREDKKRKQEEIFRETAGMPFDLTKAPLFRTVLLKLDSRMYEFMFTMHHIITDGWSMEIIKKDFNLIYEGHRTGKTVAIKSSNFQYTDFVEWHNNRLQEPSHKQDSHSYWKRKMENGIQSLTLPGDFAGGRESREGAGYYCIIEKNITERIRGLAEQENTTLFTVLFSVYLILLSRLSGEEEVPCSIISAGREHISLHSIVGFFVNSIVYSTPVDLKTPFTNFVRKIKEDTLELFRHQDYPLELIFEELGTRYPEIPVTFNMLSMLATDELILIQNAHTSNPVEVKFDLEPYITEYKNGLQVYWSYKKNLFRPETIAYIADEYIRMIDFFSRNSETSYLDYRKSTITNKSVSERKLSPLEPGFETIANAFENQVEKTPYRIAVKIKNNHFTYDELNRYAGRIAGLIGNKLKLKQGERVGLLFEHGYDMIAAIMGTLKGGQVYVPLSSSYPLKRLSYMLADSESSLLLTNNENISLAPALVEENHIEIGNIDESNHDILIEKPGISSDSPAYILYTSGSTGNPKGVVQNHENVLYYTRNWGRVFAISCEDKMTLFSSFCHDGSVQDMFGALLTGATLYPYDMKAREESTPDLSDFLNKEKITIWHSVPSLFGYFLHSLDDRKMFSHLRFI
ncbi:MAG TPA: amino acid adenylation domain-containing protein, partial [Candidatus Deferrimicrobium sp.]|nr:amino acid adenylation domain-containing protein [Candidatus Deferrimicrobium sp.]